MKDPKCTTYLILCKVIVVFLFIMPSHGMAQNFIGPKDDVDQILEMSKQFSIAYQQGDYDKMVASYTTDGKIMPGGSEIIEGTENIRAKWILPEGDKIQYHKSLPEEIRILENYAYEYGYYEGETLKANGDKQRWKGKYVIVWRKDTSAWKMYLDIWNRVM